MGKNIQTIQFLRNVTIAASRDAAISGLTTTLTTATTIYDGMIALGRYTNTSGEIVTIAGIYAVSGETKSVTIIDVEGSAADVEALRQEINAKLGSGVTSANTVTMQLTALSGNNQSTSAETSVEGAKRYADEKVRASLDVLDASSVADDNKVVSDVTQTDGQITATAKNITEVKLGGYTEGTDADIAATDTLGQALGKLQAQINAMDKVASSGDGEVVITVEETDGKVSEVKSKIKDVLLTGYVKGNGVRPIEETDTINSALSKLENSIDAAQSATTVASADESITVVTAASGTDISVNIKTGEHVLAKDGGNGVYTNIALSSVTPSSTTVREEYSLVGTDGTVLGDNIKIYKDSSLYNVYLGHVDDTITSPTDPTVVLGTGDTALCFIYLKTDGTYELVAVNVEEFIEENEFASGVTWDSAENKVRGVVDSTSEKDESNNSFLTVGEGGFKISGIKDAIDTKINKLDANVTGGTTAGTVTSDHVQVVIDEVDGKLTAVTVTETNIADKDKTVTEIASSNNSISTTSASTTDGTVKYDIVTDADKIQMSGFSADSGSALSGIAESDSIATAFEKTNTVITDNERVTAEALTDLDNRINELSSGTTEKLDEEIAARKAVDGISAQTYQATSTANYISGATSLNDADQKLDAQLKVVSDEYVSGATMNSKPITISNKVLTFTAESSSNAGDGNGIVITTNNNGGLTFALGTLDAGTY